MANRDVLLDQLDFIGAMMHWVVADLPLEAVAWRPDGEANSIGHTLWHVSRAFDILATRLLQGLPAEEELWQTRGWAARTGYDPRGIGWSGIGNISGYTQEEVAAVPILPAAEGLAYFDEAREVLRTHLAACDDARLQPPSELQFGSDFERTPIYVWVRNFLMDAAGHLGEMRAIKAMWERRNRT